MLAEITLTKGPSAGRGDTVSTDIMVWNYVKGLGNKVCWQGLGWELVEGRLGSNTEGVQRYTLEFELSLVSGSHRGSWQENGVGRSDLGKHTLEVRSPGRGSGTGRGLHLNRGLWVWREGMALVQRGGSSGAVSKQEGRASVPLDSILSTWVDSEAINGACKEEQVWDTQRGWACLQVILVSMSPGKSEISLGTLYTQERGWNPVVGNPDGKV